MCLIKPSDRFFIAGSRGMAGSAILRALKRSGYGNPMRGGELLTPSRQKLNLLDDDAVQKFMHEQQPDVVVLAAATVGGIEANRSRPTDFLLENLRIETHVIEAAWRSGVRRLLFLGSSCIYPKFATTHREESLLRGELEETNAWYAIAKIAGIKMCEALRIQHGFDAISLMPTNLYGPGDNYHPTDSHVLPSLIRRFHEAKENTETVTCWGTGKPLREFLHSDDLGEACVFALENWSALSNEAPRDDNDNPLGYLNVGTGIDLSIRELAEKIAMVVGYEGSIEWDQTKPDGTPKKQLDVSRLTGMGWKARISLTEGLTNTVKDFEQSIQERRIRGLKN